MVGKDTKIYHTMKTKSWLSIEKNIMKILPYYNYRKLFSFKKNCLFLRVPSDAQESIKNFFFY